MLNYLRVASLALSLAACGDHQPSQQPQPDAAAPDGRAAEPDARVCDLATYPPPVAPITVDLASPFALTLDGVGTRCEQLERALTDPDPTKRPPELAMLDVNGVTSTCTHNDDTNRDVVRLRAPLYAGLPLFDPPQDVVVHVDAPATVVYLHGDYLPAGYVVNNACLSGEELARSLPGNAFSYRKFLLCQYRGDGSYVIADDDQIDVGAEGYILDRDRTLRRVFALDVYLLPEHVDSDVGNSDAFCCTGTLDHCVGQRMFVDALTREIISQAPHCHSC